jgi:hypothetical protein
MLLVVAVAVGIFLAIPALSSATAQAKHRSTVIGCFNPKANKLSAEAHPSECNLAGYRNKNTEFIEMPFMSMRWHHWGAKNLSTTGSEIATGRHIRIIVYGLVACGDGRQWYSWANFVDVRTGEFFDVHLPVCGRRAATWPPKLH